MKNFSTTTRWLLLGGLLSAPYTVLMIVGTIWFYERGWLWIWLVVNALVTVVGWYFVRRWRMQFIPAPPAAVVVEPDSRWPRAGEEAWHDVEAIALRAQNEDLPLDDTQKLISVVREVLDVVARCYHPKSRAPVLEIPIPYVLRVVELVVADLRVAFSEHVPGSHILTLRDIKQMQKVAVWYQRLYLFYRVVRLGLDPASALLREMRDAAGGQLANASMAEVKRWAVGYAVNKAGYYAIQLYSGQLVLNDVELETFHSQRSESDTELADRRDESLASEPLRVLVIGQVKAGKSSLINALFGETRAAVDVIPCTKGVEPFVLERDGIQRAIILDTAGTSEGGSREHPFDAFRKEILACDLVIVVSSATSAARGPDRQLLDGVRTLFQNDPTRIMPPVLVALTHIDQLRPWNEWQPPYDLNNPSNPKSRNILAAVETTATDLQVATELVIPVCLQAERIYNVDDALVPAILENMSEAQRAKYQRCLRQFRDEEYWRRLWQQAANTGRLLARVIGELRKPPH